MELSGALASHAQNPGKASVVMYTCNPPFRLCKQVGQKLKVITLGPATPTKEKVSFKKLYYPKVIHNE